MQIRINKWMNEWMPEWMNEKVSKKVVTETNELNDYN